MATVINNPPNTSLEQSSSSGLLTALIVIALLIIAFLVFGVPRLGSRSVTNSNTTPSTNSSQPNTNNDGSGYQINGQGSVDINPR